MTSEQIDALSKPGLELKVTRQQFDLPILRSGLEHMQSEMLADIGTFYDRLMAKTVLESAPTLERETVPTKAWWDSVCSNIYGAAPGDVNSRMSPKEIGQVVTGKVAGAKAKNLADIGALLQQAVKEEWGKAELFGIAANCDLNSPPPYEWTDPTVVDLSKISDRTGSSSAKARAIALWNVESEILSDAEFAWTLGEASFHKRHEGVKSVVVHAEVDSISTLSFSANIGMGEHNLKISLSKTLDTTANNNPDLIVWEFSEE